MKNLVKDIERNCNDKSISGIIDFLNRRGDIPYTSDYHREIYFFYLEARKERFTHREAKNTTIELFKISSSTFKRVFRRFNGSIM